MTTFTDTTKNPLFVPESGTLDPFTNITVNDPNPLVDAETVTISLSASGDASLTNSNLGTITDPNGGGVSNNGTFTESGLISGSPVFATQLLNRLVYTAPELANGQSAQVTAKISVTDASPPPPRPGGGPIIPFTPAILPSYIVLQTVTDPTPVVIDTVTAPSITGTVANQPDPDVPIKPFVSTVVTDNDFNQMATDTATVIVTDGTVTTPTDVDGLLTGNGLSKTPGTAGTYTLAAANPTALTTELQGLLFTPSPNALFAPGQTIAPHLELDVTDTQANLTSKNTAASIAWVPNPPVAPVAPTIIGTIAGQKIDAGVINPFSHVTIGDKNFGAADTLTITMLNSAGVPTDANGSFEAALGLSHGTTPGVYTLASDGTMATSMAIRMFGFAAVLTNRLDQLAFQPTANGATTTFEINVTDTTYPTVPSVTDKTTTVTNPPFNSVQQPPDGVLPLGPPNNFQVQDKTMTGQPIWQSQGQPYPADGPVKGLTSEIIIATSDNINVTAEKPNVFIKTGSGEDAIDVSNVGGNNVLDGSTGSNFLVGAKGNDTFFLDDRNAAQPIWSTLVNFHSGDNATIWGIKQAGFTLSWADNEGADGFKGLTGTLNGNGTSTCVVTLAGFTKADLSDGKLSISFGRSGDLPGLPGSNFMQIHANS